MTALKSWIRRFNADNRDLGSLKSWEIKELASNVLNRSDAIFERRLRRKYGAWFDRLPLPKDRNAVLRTRAEAKAAFDAVETAGLPHLDVKDWDTRLAFAQIVDSTTLSARVLDAGTTLPSTILLWLYLKGYRNLVGCNLIFQEPFYRGSIRYEYGDIQKTTYRSAEFDAITCLSVIENDVHLGSFFKEMARILKPGGHLIVSTDHWDPKIETVGVDQSYFVASRHDFVPSRWTLFSAAEIEAMIGLAKANGLSLTGDFDKRCDETTVEHLGKSYTFVCMVFRRE